ncbi:transcriptional regulator, MerR family [Pediococcus damnosus]|uniref:Transcriptional regulator, MerR family n=2 Tax=Pediococcus damnosus TaxID=51663 RepID=A0A0R2HK45_9LACO|nr:MerR family transcriptional regulator [Pediococcus damnosus]AMV60145.1 transcriptional regulator, MerR family [Pediococcus damnosus]AMV62667.1 transcriptional regulator, MerR family [Pediococcus damnosus]AMV64390.1 transcriptional regulator, MerR family [Pediococcus damnosus]AMV67451.1 transcriptional regulator, MerR family [Pediococcus damnosus]AMV69194.1 transcriptional regulator, MerR family [Pediococcus damnosus]
MKNMIGIKQASKLSETSPDTIRYYEKVGIIAPIKRDKNGFRQFSERDIRRIKFMRHMRTAGLNISSLLEYANLIQQGDQTKDERVTFLKEQRDQLQKQLTITQSAIDQLNYKIDHYDEHMSDAKHLI